MRAAFAKTILVVDEGSLASTLQARDLLRVADRLRIPRVVLVGDRKQLDAVDAGEALRPTPGRRHEDRRHGRNPSAEGRRTEGGRPRKPRRRRPRRLRKTRRPNRPGQPRQPRRSRRRAMAPALPRSAGKHRVDGPEPRTAANRQRPHTREARPRRRHPRTRIRRRTPSLQRLHRRRKGPRRKLRPRRRRGLPARIQEASESKRATKDASPQSTGAPRP